MIVQLVLLIFAQFLRILICLGYYGDIFTNICKQCDFKCERCSDENICIQCKSDYYLTSQNTCSSECSSN